MDRKAEIALLWSLAIPYNVKTFRDADCPVVRTGYGALEKRWKQLTKASPEHRRDALMKKIEVAIGRQKAFRIECKAGGVFVPQPVGITVWLGEKRWMNDVVLKGEDAPEKKTELCECGAEIDHRPSKSCWTCYNKQQPDPMALLR